jgi:hypothetical protein
MTRAHAGWRWQWGLSPVAAHPAPVLSRQKHVVTIGPGQQKHRVQRSRRERVMSTKQGRFEETTKDCRAFEYHIDHGWVFESAKAS